ncbi:RelB antitoxin [Candidatus Magnetoovum chiemensis]|nr:RelB antitoxin [Candidatus Magnetoovum chiemensis]
MAKTARITVRTEAALKSEVEEIFHCLGITATDAINLFYHQVKLRKGLPFDVEIVNEITLQTFKDSDNGDNLVKCKDTDDFFNKLGV